MTSKTPREHFSELKTVPILPTIFTLGNIGAGFIAIALCTNNGNELFTPPILAAWMIFIGMIFDTFDGKIARLTNQCSKFGEQMDSLADLICFGVAPAILVKTYLIVPGAPDSKISWVIPLFYVFCAALRLARYNAECASPSETKVFKGLPSPAAAGSLAGIVLVQLAYPDHFMSGMVDWILGPTMVLMAILMVSPFSYLHFSNKILSGQKSFAFLIVLVVLGFFIIKFNALAIALIFNAYALAGLISGIRHIRAADIANPLEELKNEE